MIWGTSRSQRWRHLGLLRSQRPYKQLKQGWKREIQDKLRLALDSNDYHLQGVTAFNGKNGYKGNPICFREAGRMSDKDRKCDGLVKGDGVCQGHKNWNVEDWLAGLLYMIEQTERDQTYYEKRLEHLRALRVRVKKEGASAIPKIDPHPGRDRPLQSVGYISDEDEDEIKGAGHAVDAMNALDSCSDSDSSM